MAARRATARRKIASASADATSSNPWNHTWLDEVCAVLCLAGALFMATCFLSQASYRGSLDGYETAAEVGRLNLMGPIGHVTGTLLWGAMGWCGLVPAVCLSWLAVYCWRLGALPRAGAEETIGSRLLAWGRRSIGFAGVLGASCIFAAVFWGRTGGGFVGMSVAGPLHSLFNTAGAALIAGALLLLSIAMSTNLSVLELLKRGAAYSFSGIGVLFQLPLIAGRAVWFLLGALVTGIQKLFSLVGVGEFFSRQPHIETLPKPRLRKNFMSSEEDEAQEEGSSRSRRKRAEKVTEAPRDEEAETDEEAEEEDDEASGGTQGEDEGGETESLEENDEQMTHVVVSRKLPEEKATHREFVRQPSTAAPETGAPEPSEDPFIGFEPPPLSLLTRGEVTEVGEDDEELLEKSRLIEAKLRDFGVMGKVTEVHPGPVITLFEFEPAAGVKVGRIASLQDDLAMSLRASSIRIIAPIPKRGTVGIEIPNKHRDIVRLRDVLESDQFVDAESILSVCIGKDTYGEPVVADISAMPHFLIAGATGTGKSVCINALLLSLLYRAHPSELGLILIDPKILELSLYDSIPHLRVPVVSHPRQAKAVLQWAVDEMHRRYRMMQKFGVRNIDGYNRIAKGEKDPDQDIPLDDKVVMLTDDAVIEEGTVDKDGEGDGPSKGWPVEKLKPLPKIVIVIDELADLMLAAGRDIEELITRLAQKARASGIHLIVATQRPSVDVITGLIKANFPARLSFRVSSRVDSRTILDSMGAERLLGRGDMLLMLPGAEAVRRVHGAFVSDNEVKRAVTQLKQTCKPQYDERIMRVCDQALEEEAQEKTNQGEGGGEGEYDDMYDKAVELVFEKGSASTSMIQRVFRIGYNRAARIIEMMEKDGIVGPMDGAKPREVLLPRPEPGQQ
jgi:S-DNA-T family DNA segregation ATPase FtsK/SpoIIIE